MQHPAWTSVSIHRTRTPNFERLTRKASLGPRHRIEGPNLPIYLNGRLGPIDARFRLCDLRCIDDALGGLGNRSERIEEREHFHDGLGPRHGEAVGEL